MSSNTDLVALADPVCGKPVGWTSPHRHVHGGALFVFCGEPCRAQFAAHPSRLAFIALSGGLRAAKATEPDVSGPDTEPRDILFSAPVPLDESRPAATESPNRRRQARPGVSFNVLRTWRERRMATRCCRELLGLYETVAADNPQLHGTRLYQEVVAMHTRCDAGAAQVVLKKAEDSYAIWPVDRDLSFRDVVHYLAVSEILVADSASPWAEADIKRIIDAAIPKSL